MFFELDNNFKTLQDLKEKYITFNQPIFNSTEEVNTELQSLIKIYKASDQPIFKDFTEFLNKYQSEIINSFTTIEISHKTNREQKTFCSHLSNGPMEGFNRKPKDLKRNSRGLSNFYYTRNRILWSTRKKLLYLPDQNLKKKYIAITVKIEYHIRIKITINNK